MNNFIFIGCVVAVLAAAFFISMKECMVITDAQYDRLKFFADVFVPAFVIFITVISETCHIDCGLSVAGIVTAFGVFIKTMVTKAKTTWDNTSGEDLQLMAEQRADYVGERFYTDEDGHLLGED